MQIKKKENILCYGRDLYFPLKIIPNVIGGITHCPITYNDIMDDMSIKIEYMEKKNYILGIKKLIHDYKDITICVTAGRKGLGNEVSRYFLGDKFRKIIYISCNRNSLEKDFKILLDKFIIKKYYISNEFPFTNYNNIICILEKNI